MQIDPLAKVRNILRAFVGDSRNVVLVNQQHRGMMPAIFRHFLYVDNSSISDAPNAVKPSATLALQFGRPFRLSPEEGVRAHRYGCASRNNNRIESQ
jgi:hypothetical protein